MARDSKQAIKEAEASGAISRITVDEEMEKRLVSDSKKTSVKMFLASIVLLVVAFGIVAAMITFAHVIIYSLKMIVIYILILIFPFVSIYGIFTTFVAASKKDYDFYSGQIVQKTDKGYRIKGLEDQIISFPKAFRPSEDPAFGSEVKIFRIRNELSLF